MTQPERTLASAVMRHGTTLLSRRNVTDELIPASRHRCRRRVEQSSCGPFGLLHWLKQSLGSDGQPAQHRSSWKFTHFSVPCSGRKVMQMFQKGRFPLLKTFSIDFGSFSSLKKSKCIIKQLLQNHRYGVNHWFSPHRTPRWENASSKEKQPKREETTTVATSQWLLPKSYPLKAGWDGTLCQLPHCLFQRSGHPIPSHPRWLKPSFGDHL